MDVGDTIRGVLIDSEHLKVGMEDSMQQPQTPTEALEFLARSWSLPAMELSTALSALDGTPSSNMADAPCKELERIALPKLPVISELLVGEGGTPPKDRDDQKQLHTRITPKSVGLWLRDHKERRREEIRARNAQIHAATAVAGVAAAIAVAATTNIDASGSDAANGNQTADLFAKRSALMASAATLVASHCVEMARAIGADPVRVLEVVDSAVNARTGGDVMALIAAAATALRGAATLAARLQRGAPFVQLPPCGQSKENGRWLPSAWEFVSKGGDLLKRTRKGVLHWKHVSMSFNDNQQVMLKMRSIHMVGTFLKMKKSIVTGVCTDVKAWPGRELEIADGQKCYFGVRTPARLIEFECGTNDEKKRWVDGIQQMLDRSGNWNFAV